MCERTECVQVSMRRWASSTERKGEGLKESGAKPGQTVVIVGAGCWLIVCQYTRAVGLDVVGIDGGPTKQSPRRRNFVRVA